MPSSKTITPRMKDGLLDCFDSASQLLPAALRKEFVLVGSAASLHHGSKFYTSDLDIAASAAAHQALMNAIGSGASNFSIDAVDLSISYQSPKIGQIIVEILGLGAEFVDGIAHILQVKNGFVASVPDLLRLWSATVADRGEDGDLLDFRWLIQRCFEIGGVLPLLRGK
ncbi:hypothetical protein KCU65_g3253, partial [Aureobasidium melanogenum]